MGEDQPVTGNPLLAALQPVLDDLEATQPGLIDVVPQGEDIWLRDRSGSGAGLPAQWRDFPDQLPLLVVEAAQVVRDPWWSVSQSPSVRRVAS